MEDSDPWETDPQDTDPQDTDPQDTDPRDTDPTFDQLGYLNLQAVFDETNYGPPESHFDQYPDLGESWVPVQGETEESAIYDGAEVQAQEH
jgi:hypothetical protein